MKKLTYLFIAVLTAICFSACEDLKSELDQNVDANLVNEEFEIPTEPLGLFHLAKGIESTAVDGKLIFSKENIDIMELVKQYASGAITVKSAEIKSILMSLSDPDADLTVFKNMGKVSCYLSTPEDPALQLIASTQITDRQISFNINMANVTSLLTKKSVNVYIYADNCPAVRLKAQLKITTKLKVGLK